MLYGIVITIISIINLFFVGELIVRAQRTSEGLHADRRALFARVLRGPGAVRQLRQQDDGPRASGAPLLPRLGRPERASGPRRLLGSLRF